MRKRCLSWALAVAMLCAMAASPVRGEAAEAAEKNKGVPTLAVVSGGAEESMDSTGMGVGETAGESIDATGAGNPANPVHHCSLDGDSDTTDWSYVYFGSYPQTEVTGSAMTAAIRGASFDANGDAWVNGTKYRRISISDTNNSSNFGNQQYRYFKWERIRWRVLRKNGSDLFIMADGGLDCKDYHDPGGSVTWESSTVRSWLNKGFYDTAFADAEKSAIAEQTIDNEDNPAYGTEGGNSTRDKVFLLSIAEATNQLYGFCDDFNTSSASRRLRVSDYAHASGAWISTSVDDARNCRWWLRSPGGNTFYAADVDYYGIVDRNAYYVNIADRACVPALHINLSSNYWYATDDGTSGNGGENLQPLVLGPIANQTVQEGASATFRVTASGGRPSSYTYQWYFAPTVLDAGTPISGAVSASYTIPASDMTADLNGRYLYCVVSNGVYQITSNRAKLTVIEKTPETIPVTSVTLNHSDLSLKVGETQQLRATVQPWNATNRSVRWTVSNPAVAALNANGESAQITAISAGTAVITATSGGKTANCTVTVSPKDNPTTPGGSGGGGTTDPGSSSGGSGTTDPGGSGGSGGSTAAPGGSGGASTPGDSAQKPAAKLQTPKVKARLSSAKAIKLTWGKVKNASGYTIYRAESKKGKYKKIGTAKKTSYTDKKVKSGKTYYYKAQAYKGKTKSSLSGAVSKKIPQKPEKPNVELTAGGGKFTLAWGSIKGAGQVEIWLQIDNGKWKKFKTVSAKKKKFSYSYDNFNWSKKFRLKVRGYWKSDGLAGYGDYSKTMAVEREN